MNWIYKVRTKVSQVFVFVWGVKIIGSRKKQTIDT